LRLATRGKEHEGKGVKVHASRGGSSDRRPAGKIMSKRGGGGRRKWVPEGGGVFFGPETINPPKRERRRIPGDI